MVQIKPLFRSGGGCTGSFYRYCCVPEIYTLLLLPPPGPIDRGAADVTGAAVAGIIFTPGSLEGRRGGGTSQSLPLTLLYL